MLSVTIRKLLTIFIQNVTLVTLKLTEVTFTKRVNLVACGKNKEHVVDHVTIIECKRGEFNYGYICSED